jgi:hypothetical protein
MAKAADLSPGNDVVAYKLALMNLASGDRDHYVASCAAMLTRFGHSKQPEVANTVAWTCTLTPGAVSDPARVVEVAMRAFAGKPTNANYMNTLGAALYRAGQFEAARQRLAEVVKARQPDEDVMDWLYLAMAHHRLEHRDEARRWLDKAEHALHHSAADQPPAGAKALLSWAQRLELRLLKREATALIMGVSRPQASHLGDTLVK